MRRDILSAAAAVFQFVKKNADEISKDRQIRKAVEDVEKLERLEPVYSGVFKLYGIVGAVFVAVGLLASKRGKKQRQKGRGSPIVRV